MYITYKEQMKIQKVFCFVTLIACALLLLYSFGLVTDLYDSLYYTMSDPDDIYNMKTTYVSGAWIFFEIQPFNKALTTVALVLLGCSLLPFFTNTHSRRKYYLSNYITVGISCLANITAAIWCTINIIKFKHQFLTTVDFAALKEYSDFMDTPYIESTFWFDIGFIVCELLIIAAVLNIYNLVWKTKLMRKEKQLIQEGLEG